MATAQDIPEVTPLDTSHGGTMDENKPAAADEMSNKKAFGRKMDFMESMVASYSFLANVAHVMVVESAAKITEEALRRAALLLSRRHPLLRSKVVRELDPRKRKGELFYREMDKDDTLIDLRVVDEIDWHETQVADGKTMYDTENGPLWRLWLLKSQEITADESETGHTFRTNIVLGYHHAILDANTGMKLIDQLLTYLEMVHDGSAENLVLESLPLLPSFYDLLPPRALRFPWWQKPKLATLALKELFKSKKNLYTKHHQTEMTKNPDVAQQTEILPVVISSSLTSEILKRSKQNGVTVHGAITAASAIAMVQLIFGEDFQSKKTISTLFHTNMRRYLASDVGDEHMGAFFGTNEMPIKVQRVTSDEEFWKIAKTCYQQVHHILERDVMEVTKIYKYLVDDLGLDLMKMLVNVDKTSDGRMRPLFSISNMGRCDYVTRENGREFELTGTYMCVAAPLAGPIFVNNVFTFRSKMYLSNVYYSHITSKDRAQEYADFFVRALEIGCQVNM